MSASDCMTAGEKKKEEAKNSNIKHIPLGDESVWVSANTTTTPRRLILTDKKDGLSGPPKTR
jgi:hypothetical protein